MQHLVEAQVIDKQHLKLTTPITFTPGSIVMITIEPAVNIAEDHEWYLLSQQILSKGYSAVEPDYSVDKIKIPNPDYMP